MYTLRIFKDKSASKRMQFYLGKSYSIGYSEKEDQELNIKMRVFGSDPDIPNDGLAIFNDDHSFIMSSTGETFEVLNRPVFKKNDRGNTSIILDHMRDICNESLSPESFVNFEKIIAELSISRSDVK